MDTAAARRNRMQVRVYPSLAAHDRDDARFWAAPEERVMVKDGDQLELTVAVYSETDVSWLPAAQAIAAGLFEDAGIRVAWIACGAAEHPACQRPPAGHELVVRIKARRVDRTSHTCGVALRPSQGAGSYVTLFVDCLIVRADGAVRVAVSGR